MYRNLSVGDRVCFTLAGGEHLGTIDETIDSEDDYFIVFDECIDGDSCRYIFAGYIICMEDEMSKTKTPSGLSTFLEKHNAV